MMHFIHTRMGRDDVFFLKILMGSFIAHAVLYFGFAV